MPGRKVFLDAVNKVAQIKAVYPKQNSIDNQELKDISDDYPVFSFAKNQVVENFPQIISDILSEDDNKIVLLDIGGYFEKILKELNPLRERILGIVEDTENGHQKYENSYGTSSIPIISAARSELKQPEDELVGRSIVFSLESCLRKQNEVLQGQNCLVIGYGKVGRGISRELKSRSANIHVYDHDPLKRIHANADGFNVISKKDVSSFDVILCATGNNAMTPDEFLELKNNCYVATATSSDDEFENDFLSNFHMLDNNQYMSRHRSESGKIFQLLNNGNAVNFLDRAVVGNFIYLVQAELVRSIQCLQNSDELFLSKNKIGELPKQQKIEIAALWEQYFM